MTEKVQKKRVAIYTRKSVEEGLDMEFNSLDAQREAAEAYILSQRANGWYALPKHYDDAGFSGGNTKRPALKELLADCRAGMVDIVIVYKIDRLSRNLCDFLELTKLFEKYSVSFVSVTQEINTSTSSGRMMLNILATFSQYEREIIAERIRDKFAASKKKGMWMGGCLPLGYRVENRKLIVVPEEAKVVQMIFERYIDLQSPIQLALELNMKGYRTKTGKRWNQRNMFHILRNCTYVGMIPYKGESYPGEHEAIIDRETWDAVQRFLESRQAAKPKTLARRTERTMPLKGQVYCGHCGGPMTLTMTQRKHRAYGYYRCSRDEKRAESKCPVRHISANELERAAFTVLSSILRTPMMLARLEDFCDAEVPQIADAIGQDFWNEATLVERRNIAEFLVAKVTLYVDRFELEIKADGISAFKDQIDHEMKEESAKTEMLPSGNVLVSVPFDLQVRGNGKCLVLPDGAVADKSRTAFLMAVARGRKWQRDIDEGKVRDIKELTEILSLDQSYVSRILRLAHLAPPLIERVINGTIPENLCISRVRNTISNIWDDQLQEFRVEA
jgi:site-specific DNA recombinase